MAKSKKKAADSAQVTRLREALAREKAKSTALANERAEAREQQAAAAAILKAISRSPGDAQPVFDAIVKRALRLTRGYSAVVTRIAGATAYLGAFTSTSKAGDAAIRRGYPRPIDRASATGRAVRYRRPSFVADIEKVPGSERSKRLARKRGYRSLLAVPLLCDGAVVGTLNVTRKEPGPFSKPEIALLQTFAEQAVIAIENVRLFNETKEALEQQTAISEVLRVISGSPADVQPVLEAVAVRAAKICDASDARIALVEGDHFRHAAGFGDLPPAQVLFPLERGAPIGRAVIDRKTLYIRDIQAETGDDFALARKIAAKSGWRSNLVVPLMRKDKAVGAIALRRRDVRPFTPKQISLLQTFADQAAIAIENVRLFNETKEALEQQTAISEILRVMSDSPADVNPVLEAVAERSMQICESSDARIFVVEGAELRYVTGRGEVRSLTPGVKRPLTRGSVMGRSVIDKLPVHVEDLAAASETEYPLGREIQRQFGHRTTLGIPLLREGKALGVIVLRRKEVRPFSEKEISLLRTFSDQAAIAIENVRLFNETKEALERQTATAEILKVIAGSPTDVQPVFDVIVERAVRLCGARFGRVYRYDGSIVQMVASHGLSTGGLQSVRRVFPRPASDDTIVGRVIRGRRPYFVRDIQQDGTVPILSRQMIEALGTRSQVTVPMLRAGEPIGAITMGWEQPDGFDDRQVALLQTFADQAVIAIENVRLFNETKEALERQTATAEVLQVLSGSPSSLRPVFEAILANATRLCNSHIAVLNLYQNGKFRTAAQFGGNPEFVRWVLERDVFLPSESTTLTRMIETKQPVQAEDLKQSEAYRAGKGQTVNMVNIGGARTFLAVPLYKDGELLGNIGIYRPEVLPFTDKQIDLVRSFANQAVIAIENVRLFNETKEALERQIATADILKVIGSSPTDTQPVFAAIVQGGLKLFPEATIGVTRPNGARLDMVAIGHRDPGIAETTKKRFPIPLTPDYLNSRAILEARMIDLPDAELEKDGPFAPGVRNFLVTGNRAMTVMPMLRGDEAIGTISVTRATPGALTDKQLSLLRIFADQAVIAIENVRLFNETKEALERQTATAEILKVIASSPSDVQPVFDAIVTSGARLFGRRAVLRLAEGGELRRKALSDPASGTLQGVEAIPIDPDSLAGRVYLEARSMQVVDTHAPDAPPFAQKHARTWNFRANAAAPLLLDGKSIGLISMNSPEPGALSDKQMELLQTFADQAVIAIQNVRLFNETKEALERQTATAEILKVIASSPSDVQPVFDAIARSATRLVGGFSTVVARLESDVLRLAALTSTRNAGDEAVRTSFPLPLANALHLATAIREGEPRWIVDIETEADSPVKATARVRGWRSAIAVPMLRGATPVGVINVTRVAAGPFSDHEVGLLKTFADQAVIAIENVRLFNETREALERQTATGEILKVIASSPSDVQPVFDAIVNSVATLFGRKAALRTVEPDGLRRRARSYEPTPGEFHGPDVEPLDEKSIVGQAILAGRALQWADTLVEGAATYGTEKAKSLAFRSIASAPLIRDGNAIGVISVSSPQPGSLSDKQMELLSTFADQAVIAIENVRLFNETKEALEQQQASAEILRIVSQSVADSQPVFDAILAAVQQLFLGFDATVWRVEGDRLVAVARGGPTTSNTVGHAVQITPDYAHGIAVLERRPVRLDDIASSREITEVSRQDLLSRNRRCLLLVPLLREGDCLGAISVSRTEPYQFVEKQVAVLKTFADQAVIAIENTRLFNETKEALERQTATAEVLKVISGSLTDTQPVFDIIAERAARLTGAAFGWVFTLHAGLIHASSWFGLNPQAIEVAKKAFPMPPSGRSYTARAIRDGQILNVADALAETDPEYATKPVAAAAGYRSVLAVPMFRDQQVIGAIVVNRAEPGAFTEKEVELLKTFADQAVIAIENVRLFNETRESLERQTATAEILNVIASSPSDVQPVFDAIAASARRLLGGHAANVARRIGDTLELAAFTSTGEAGDSEISRLWPAKITGKGHMGRALLSAAPAGVEDIETDLSYSEEFRAGARLRGMRSAVSVPMLREGEAIGVISVNRSTPGRFSDHQTNLLKTFADQAVIAIENVRLFNETKEALERQTATAEILKVISSSPTDVQPVFDAIVKSAARLFDPWVATITILENGQVHWKATASMRELDRAIEQTRSIYPLPFDPERSPSARAMLERRIVEIPDTTAPGVPEFTRRAQLAAAAGGRHQGFGAITFVPLTRESKGIGTIILTNRQVGAKLTDKQLELVKTFADQAVIAIENVRLFKELETRTDALGKSVQKLTALGEVGQAISSTLDLEAVLKKIATHAVRLTGLDNASIYEYDEASEAFRLQAADNVDDDLLQTVRRYPIRKGDGTVGGVAITREPAQVPDILDKGYRSTRKDLLIRAGYRAVLTVPLLREEGIIGALSVSRKTPGPFPDEIVELMKTFATQSAMAIQNARLFREIAEKGKQLEEASKHKSQFLASMSHELRTPLNAILGFNEMILGDVYGEVPADMKEPLTDIQTSGKHLLRLINNVLDLAKIEAGRMELALDDYSVHDTVESVRSTLRPLAEAKGLGLAVDVPNDIPLARGDGGRITQCLMNLAGNSLKFTKQGSVGISVALANGTLTYRVKDTGIGIPADKIGSLFTEFKQTDATIASEYGGTGLGLSITKKFIEMHGGRIWAESVPGSGSTFTFEVPLRTEEAKEA